MLGFRGFGFLGSGFRSLRVQEFGVGSQARTAIWRLRRCVVGLQMEDPQADGFRV